MTTKQTKSISPENVNIMSTPDFSKLPFDRTIDFLQKSAMTLFEDIVKNDESKKKEKPL